MRCEEVKLEDLVCMDKPSDVFAEVARIVLMMFPGHDFTSLKNAFSATRDVFAGRFPGYRECNILYHDLKHTMDCFLAMARLIHGAHAAGVEVTERGMVLGLISSLLHDTGYIQFSDDLSGTGAKHTLHHVDRSIDFTERYLASRRFSTDDFRFCRDCLKCTGLDIHIYEIAFVSQESELLGKMLGAADLLGQMADRTYLEKLPCLYWEFEEGGVPGFESEFDVIVKTPGFWEFVKERLAGELSGVDRFSEEHFRLRWGISKDLYREAIDRSMEHLKSAIESHGSDHRYFFKRRIQAQK